MLHNRIGNSPRNLWGELLTGLASIAGAVFLGYSALDFPSAGEQFPLFISSCMIMVGILMLITPVLKPVLYRRSIAPERSWDTWKPLVVLALTVLYVIAIFRIGYYVSTFAFLILTPILVGIRRPVIVLGNSVACLVFIYALFQVLLNIPLPSGIIF